MSTVTIAARPAAGHGPAGALRTAFVQAGGAALGAMQAGMVHALYERGIVPDLLVGTLAEALSAAFLASRPPTVATAEHWRPSGAGCGAATSSRSARPRSSAVWSAPADSSGPGATRNRPSPAAIPRPDQPAPPVDKS